MMHKLFFWIGFSAIFCFSVEANCNYQRIKKLHYTNSIGEKALTTFYYSQNNKNYMAKWELLDGSRYSFNYHLLDEQGRLIRKYKEFSDSMTSNNYYKYDEMGNLVEDYFERSDKIKGVAWYFYKDGKKISAECRGYNGYFYGFIEFVYENGILSKGLIFKEGKETGFIKYEYDDLGNLLSEFWNFGNWNQTFTYEYEKVESQKPISYSYSSPFLLDSKIARVKEEKYCWNNEKEGKSSYIYDGDEKLIKKIYSFDEISTSTTFEYNDDGLLMVSSRLNNNGDKITFYYLYNAHRKLIHRICFGKNGFFGSESYKYDNLGNFSEASWSNFDSWLTGELTFNYSDNVLSSGSFEGKDGFNADLFFKSDSLNRIIRIDWNFSFGKSQFYIFSYF